MPTQSFDQNMKKFFDARRLLVKHSEGARKEYQLAKNQAYTMAQAFIRNQAEDSNRLIEMAKSEVGDGPNIIDRWLEHSFGGLTALGEDLQELITAIHGGMTRKQYMASTSSVFLSSKRRKSNANAADKTPLPPKPQDDLTPEEQLEMWRSRALAAEHWKPRALDAERRLAKLEKQVKKLNHLLATTA